MSEPLKSVDQLYAGLRGCSWRVVGGACWWMVLVGRGWFWDWVVVVVAVGLAVPTTLGDGALMHCWTLGVGAALDACGMYGEWRQMRVAEIGVLHFSLSPLCGRTGPKE
jgi:hypothetical protein